MKTPSVRAFGEEFEPITVLLGKDWVFITAFWGKDSRLFTFINEIDKSLPQDGGFLFAFTAVLGKRFGLSWGRTLDFHYSEAKSAKSLPQDSAILFAFNAILGKPNINFTLNFPRIAQFFLPLTLSWGRDLGF